MLGYIALGFSFMALGYSIFTFLWLKKVNSKRKKELKQLEEKISKIVNENTSD